MPVLPFIPAIASVAGGIAGGRAEGRLQEAELQQNADRIALDRSRLGHDQNMDSVQADIDQRTYADKSNDRSARNALMAGLLGGLQDYEMNLPAGLEGFAPKSTGGLRPSAILNRDEISRLAMETAMSELADPLQPGGIAREAPQGGTTAQPRRSGTPGRGGMRGDDPLPAAGDGDIGASPVAAERSGRYLPQILLSQLPQAGALPQPGLLDKILNGVAMGGGIAGAVSPAFAPRTTGGPTITATGNPADIMRNAGVRF